MASSTFSKIRHVVDVVCFVIVLVATLVLYLITIEPVQRGFFCSDETIQYPYREDTVSSPLAIVLGVLVAIIPVCLLEALRLWFLATNEDAPKKGKVSFLRQYVVQLYLQISIFLYGAAMCMLITEFLKVTVGRLRPHFIDLCKPDPSSYNCSDGYITNFRCSSDVPASKLIDARKSFPSGHSSFTAFAVTYFLMYLQIRLPRRESRMLRPMLQMIFTVGGLYILVSRISDHKHHWTDVLAGSILGFVSAVLTVIFFSDLWGPLNQRLAMEASIYPMTSLPSPSTPKRQYEVNKDHTDVEAGNN